MKNKKNLLLKFILLATIAMTLPAVSSAPTFTTYAYSEISISEGGTDDPSDNGGSKPVEAPKGGGILDKIVDGVKTVLSGLLSGSGTPDSSKNC